MKNKASQKKEPYEIYLKHSKELERQNEELLKLLEEEEDEEDEYEDEFEDDEDDFIPYSEFKEMGAEEFVARSVKPAPVITPPQEPEEEPKRKRNAWAIICCFCIAFTCFGFSYYMDHVVGDFMALPVILGGLFLVIGIGKF